MEALAVGLEEGIEERYLRYRSSQVRHLADELIAVGVPVVRPIGGHAVYIDAALFLPHLSLEELPGEALVAQLYLRGGIRAARLSGAMARVDESYGAPMSPHFEFVRLSIPRRVYTQTHLDYVAEVIADTYRHRDEVVGMRLISVPASLPLWMSEYEPMDHKSVTSC
jgi:tyrosine phenol-lyase